MSHWEKDINSRSTWSTVADTNFHDSLPLSERYTHHRYSMLTSYSSPSSYRSLAPLPWSLISHIPYPAPTVQECDDHHFAEHCNQQSPRRSVHDNPFHDEDTALRLVFGLWSLIVRLRSSYEYHLRLFKSIVYHCSGSSIRNFDR